MNEKIKLSKKISDDLAKILEHCDLCPRACRINRTVGQKGYCCADSDMVVYTSFLHRGEEPAISGNAGSGTIFFSGCNLRCVYCQNYKFSHSIQGTIMSHLELSNLMIGMQENGAHNINLVTPTHFLPQIIKALHLAFVNGLTIPIVYNTSSYERKEIIQKLNGMVDIYLADIRYFDDNVSKLYSNAKDYPFNAKESILEMYKQKPEPAFDDDLLKEALVIRHLVLPGYIEESKKILSWIKQNTPGAILSLMYQYQPYYKAKDYPNINRTVSRDEYVELNKFMTALDLDGWVQDLAPQENLAGVYFKEEPK